MRRRGVQRRSMRAGRARVRRAGVWCLVPVVLAVAVSACGMKEVPREDWGAITPDASIRVTTLAAESHDLTDVHVFTDALEGRTGTDSASVRIPLDSIDFVESSSGSRVLPILTAIAATVTTVAIIRAMGKSDVAPPPTPVNSCPFIYSFDGHDYRLDSETFAGAITRGVQRTDLDNLDHLRAVDGEYRLRLTNERPETQYTDELTLRVVDHPVGTLVHPDIAAEPHVVRDARSPSSAITLRGADALGEVADADGLWWTGDPVEAIDMDDPASFRDGLELAFARPEGDRGLLVVRARNSELAPYALQTFLELFGDGLVGWYRSVDRDPALQAKLRAWVMREGTLHVSVWIHGGWRLQDVLLDVGPHLAKTQVARLDLSGVEGGEVRVRLEGARGLWGIDEVSLGTAEAPSRLVVRDLAPVAAVDPEGRDLASRLSRSDDVYLTTLRGHVLELTFAEPPPPAAGFERTVLARTTGFYHIYVDQTGSPRPDIADRILEEPLFGNRYVLGRLLETRPDG